MRTDPRVFFAVWPPEAVARTLHGAARAAQRDCGGRLMRRETLHLTLAFLGELPGPRLADATAVAADVAVAPFSLALDRLGYWKHNRILWAGGECPPLAALAATLGQGLRDAGFALESRPFAAHMTLLRDARCAAVPALDEPVAWPVAEFVLAASRTDREGAHYEAIGRWPLVG